MIANHLITQSILPPPISPSLLPWACEDQIHIVFNGAEWIQDELPALPQYELFLDPQIESGTLFRTFVDRWRTERGVRSSTTDILLSPSYQSIIGLGPKAVPLILAQMESEGDDPDQWFFALQVLTHANPVAEEDEGDFNAMAKAWIDWARKRYIW